MASATSRCESPSTFVRSRRRSKFTLDPTSSLGVSINSFTVPLLARRATIRGHRLQYSAGTFGTGDKSYWRPLHGDSFAERKAGLWIRRFRGKSRISVADHVSAVFLH